MWTSGPRRHMMEPITGDSPRLGTPGKRPPAGLPRLEPWSVGYWQRPQSILAPHGAASGGGTVRGENMAWGPRLAG